MASISTSLTKNKSQSKNNSRGTETCQYKELIARQNNNH